MKKKITRTVTSELEQLVRDPRWNQYWVLRAIHFPKWRGGQTTWCVWDATAYWTQATAGLLPVTDPLEFHLSPESAARAALESVKVPHA